MAGEFERLKWVLDLELNDSELRRAIRAIGDETQRLTQRAATPGTRLTAGGAGGRNLATETGELQALVAQFEQRVAAAQKAKQISPSIANEFRREVGGKNVEQSVIGGLTGRENQRGVDAEKFRRTMQDARDKIVSSTQGTATVVEGTRQDAAKARVDQENANRKVKDQTDQRARSEEKARLEHEALINQQAAGLRSFLTPGAPVGPPPPGSGTGGRGSGGPLPGAPTGGPTSAQAASSYLGMLRNAQEALDQQRAATAQSTIQQKLLATSGSDLIAANAQLAVLRKTNAAREQSIEQQLLAGEASYIQATAEAANARRLSSQLVKAKELQGVGLESVNPETGLFIPTSGKSDAEIEQLQKKHKQGLDDLTGKNQANARIENARVAAARDTLLLQEGNVAALVQERQAHNKLNSVLKTQIAAAERAAFQQRLASGSRDPNEVGTLFQRLQSRLAGRGGNFRDPREFQQLGQFISSRFLTTAGFAVSGLVTYAAISGLQNMVKSAAELQRTLSQVEAQFNSLGDGASFAGFRDGILGISRATGAAANDVAKIAFQFKGAFGAGDGKPGLGNTQILDQVQAAVQISKVTGLSLEEVTDSLTAAALSYETDVRSIGDVTLALQERTGVLATHIITAVADLAPVAKQVGLELEDIAAFAAVAQERSGRSGAALAEGFNRVLPAIQQNAAELYRFYQQVDPQKAPQLLDDLAKGQTGAVFKTIGEDFKNFSAAQKNFIIEMLGGRREAQNIIPVLENYGEVMDNITAAQNSAGKTSQYFGTLQETLSQQFARIGAQVQQFGEAILRSGVGDALSEIAKAFATLLEAAGGITRFLVGINEAFGEIPGKVITFTLAVVALTKALKALQEIQLASTIAGFFGGRAGGVAAGTATKTGFLGNVPLLGRIFGGGKVPAAGAGAVAGTEEALLAGSTGAGATVATGLGTAATAGIAAGVIVGVIALNRYMDFRKKASAKAAEQVKELAKKDLPELEKLLDQNKPGTGEAIGRALTGQKTDFEKIRDAIQIRTTEDDLLPRLNALTEAYKDRSESKKFLDELIKELGDSGGSGNKEFDKAKGFVDAYNNLSRLSNVQIDTLSYSGDAVASLLQQGATDFDPDSPTNKFTVRITERLRIQVEAAKKLVELERKIGLGGNPQDIQKLKDEANAIRQNFFNNSAAPAQSLLNTTLQFQTEFKTTRTIAGLSPTELGNAGLVIEKLGSDIESKIGLVKDAQEVGDAINKLGAVFVGVKEIQGDYKEGKVGISVFQGKLQVARDAALAVLRRARELKYDAKIIEALQADFDNIDSALSQVKKQAQELRINAAVRPLQLSGASEGAIEFRRQGAILNELKNQGLTPAERLELANKYLESQQAYVDYLASQAPTEEEANAIRARGVKIDPAVQKILNYEQLEALPENETAFLQAVAEKVDLIYEDFVDYISEAMLAGKSAREAVQAALKKRIEEILLVINVAGGSDQAAIDELNRLAGLYYQSGSLFGGVTPSNRTRQQQENTDPEDQRKKAKELALSQLAIARAQANGDPIREAEIARQQANVEYQYATTAAEKNNAIAQQIEADNSYKKAVNERSKAYLNVLRALADGDPVKEAELAMQGAQLDYAAATSDAERLNAIAAYIEGQHAKRDALRNAAYAQQNLLIAMATARGDLIEAAELSLQLAEKQYADLIAGGVDPKSQRAKEAAANVVTQKANLRDTILNEQIETINFDLEMEKISTGQAIARLQNLLSTADLTEAEKRQIQRQIKSLKDQLEKDLQFNIPDIVVPTLYQVRRAESGVGLTPGGGASVQDNRVITVTVVAQTNASPEEIGNVVAKQVNAPSRYGMKGKLY